MYKRILVPIDGSHTSLLGIVKHAKLWRADIIVIGTHWRKGVSRLVMGSDAEQVLRISPVPVLVVRTGTSRR